MARKLWVDCEMAQNVSHLINKARDWDFEPFQNLMHDTLFIKNSSVNDFLEDFHFKWLDSVEIGKAIKIPTILNHLKWNLS